MKEVIKKKICSLVDGPCSAELVTGSQAEEMIAEAEVLCKVGT